MFCHVLQLLSRDLIDGAHRRSSMLLLGVYFPPKAAQFRLYWRRKALRRSEQPEIMEQTTQRPEQTDVTLKEFQEIVDGFRGSHISISSVQKLDVQGFRLCQV